MFCKNSYLTHFWSPSSKNKKKFLYFLIFQEIELYYSNVKKLLIFSQKKAFLIFGETETLKKIICVSRNRTFLYFRKLLTFQEVTFWAREETRTCSEKVSYISSHKLKKRLIFQERTCKAWKSNISYISSRIFCLLREI